MPERSIRRRPRLAAVPSKTSPVPAPARPSQAGKPPGPPKLPRRSASTGSDLPKWQMVIGLALVVIAVLAMVWNTLVKHRIGYAPNYVRLAVTRTLPATAAVNVEDFFSHDLMQQYIDQGRGLIITFKTEETGRSTEEKEEVVIEASPTASIDAIDRKAEVQKGRAKLERVLAAFNAPPPARLYKLPIFVDVTDKGVDEEYRQQVIQRVISLEIGARVEGGNSAQLIFHPLTNSFFFQGKMPLAIPPGMNAATANAAVQEYLRDSMPDQRDRLQSSISTALFNAIGETGVDEDTQVVVYSDGLEHSPDTVMLESRPYNDPAYVESHAAEIMEKIQAIKSAPDFKGAKVDWFLPPRDQQARLMITVMNRVWLPLLESKGAKVELHF